MNPVTVIIYTFLLVALALLVVVALYLINQRVL